MSRAAQALVLGAFAVSIWAPTAHAEEVTAAQLRDLAARAAAGDNAALERIRAVDSVDGRPADLARALGGASDGELAHRLRAIAAGGTGPAAIAPAPDARRRARDILADRRFHEPKVPRPFRRPLRWLGDRLRPMVEAFEDAFIAVARFLPGGRLVAWALVALLVCAAAVLLARSLARRRSAIEARAQREERRRRDDPRELERLADRAERDGDWEAAVRLRFRAGVVRLAERDVIASAASTTTGELAEALRSRRFDDLGARFDAIAYGGRPAAREDAESARAAWPAVLEEARRR